MDYQDGMQKIDSSIMERVLSAREGYSYHKYSTTDVQNTLTRLERLPRGSDPDLTETEFKILLSEAVLEPSANGEASYLERIAQICQALTRAHFGNSINLFTPLYLANYCQSNCVYCGFSAKNSISRVLLNEETISAELDAISETGLQEILLLTGESWVKSDPKYIARACQLAGEKFANVGVEVYPMNVADYELLQRNGCDYVTVFQETYDPERYEQLHLAGQKRSFPYRFNAQERAIMGGMRGVAFGALFGIADFRKDAFSLGLHAALLQRKYPHAEISVSCPRLRPAAGNTDFLEFQAESVTERDLVQVICAYRLMLPFAAITVSTREDAHFRDSIVKFAATKVSAGVDTGIGHHSGVDDGEEQFDISDKRSVPEIINALKLGGLQPVLNEHVMVGHESN
jgi:2-iminoacetate synthase